MFCFNCGTELEEGSKFCTNCGTPLDVESGSQVAAEHEADVTKALDSLSQPTVIIDTSAPQTTAQMPAAAAPAAQPSATAPYAATAYSASNTAGSSNSKSNKKVIIIAVVIIVLAIVVGVVAAVVVSGMGNGEEDEATTTEQTEEATEEAAEDESEEAEETETSTSQANSEEQDIYDALLIVYENASTYSDEVGDAATDFNNNYLESSYSKRSGYASEADDLREKIYAASSSVETMAVSSTSVNYNAWKDICTLYGYLENRIDVICEAWDKSLSYSTPADHKEAILAILNAEQEDGHNIYYTKFNELYPNVDLVDPS